MFVVCIAAFPPAGPFVRGEFSPRWVRGKIRDGALVTMNQSNSTERFVQNAMFPRLKLCRQGVVVEPVRCGGKASIAACGGRSSPVYPTKPSIAGASHAFAGGNETRISWGVNVGEVVPALGDAATLHMLKKCF